MYHSSFQPAFRTNITTGLDERNYALQQCKVLPVRQLIQMMYPDLYPLHRIMEVVSSYLYIVDYL